MLGEAVSYTESADMWALGALAYAMATCNVVPNIASLPVEKAVGEACAVRGWSGGVDDALPARQVLRLMTAALHPSPDKRPSARAAGEMLRLVERREGQQLAAKL